MLPGEAVSFVTVSLPNGRDNTLMIRGRAFGSGPEPQCQHPRAMSLIGHRLSNTVEATVAATRDQGPMERVVGNGPSEKIAVAQSPSHPRGGLVEFIGDGLPLRFSQ